MAKKNEWDGKTIVSSGEVGIVCDCGGMKFIKGSWGGEPCLYCARCSAAHDPNVRKASKSVYGWAIVDGDDIIDVFIDKTGKFKGSANTKRCRIIMEE